MVQRKRAQEEKVLTEVELEVMNAIWALGRCTVREVHEALSQERELAYTSVATMMKILEQKRILRAQKGEKAHFYEPLLLKSEYEAMSLKHLANHLFEGSPTSMVMRLLDGTDLSKPEIDAIRKLLAKKSESRS